MMFTKIDVLIDLIEIHPMDDRPERGVRWWGLVPWPSAIERPAVEASC